MNQDKALDQLLDWKIQHGSQLNPVLNSHGAAHPTLTKSLTVGQRGPILLQDTNLIETLAHFDRERIPERVVHAKGAAAFGYFEVDHDITNYTKAKVFESVGKRTPVAVRFSTVGGESGSADSVRDPRGFATKFYTEDGNWDLVGNNTPIFFIRDPILFPSFIHTQKRNPQTHLKDPNMVWDFMTLRPETTHQFSFLFSDRGIPDGYRHMNGYGSHTFKLVNAGNESVYCKFHLKTNQGIKNLPVDVAHQLTADDPDYSLHDLYNSIANGHHPSWTMFIQVMTFDEASKFRWNPFDVTKVWPHAQFPLIPVGKLVLDRNPTNYFNEVEQLAFTPANMIPGIEPSPDKMLQGRLFSYADTHRHRLGPNYAQLPVNAPVQNVKMNIIRGGWSNHNQAQGGTPNYFPNSFSSSHEDEAKSETIAFHLSGDVQRFDSSGDDNFSQVTTFWTMVLKPDERKRLVENIVGSLKSTHQFIQQRAITNFTQVHGDFGRMIRDGLQTSALKADVAHSHGLHHLENQTKFNYYHHDIKSNL